MLLFFDNFYAYECFFPLNYALSINYNIIILCQKMVQLNCSNNYLDHIYNSFISFKILAATYYMYNTMQNFFFFLISYCTSMCIK